MLRLVLWLVSSLEQYFHLASGIRMLLIIDLNQNDMSCVYFILCLIEQQSLRLNMGPSIYDVHTEGGQAQVDACGRGMGGPAPCGRPHRKLKLESTDFILSSSHAKKLASFLPEFRLWTEKKWKFFCDIN